MNQSKYAEMDLKQAITVFTKTLLWKLHEGHPVADDELEALNSLRANAGMQPLRVPKFEPQAEPKVEPKVEPKAEPKKQNSPPESEPEQTETGEETGMVIHVPRDAKMLPDNGQWTNRFQIKSESSDNLYNIAQNKNRRFWGCSCRGWISHRKCKHLKEMGLPFLEQPFEATLKQASVKRGVDLMHSDNDLALKLEPAVAGEVHIEGPEAGASNDELHASGHAENGGSPVYDGSIKSPERANVNAIREALETQVEMEVGKPLNQKQKEVAIAEEVRDGAAMHPGAGTQAISAKPGTQVIINIAAKKKKAMYDKYKCPDCGTPVAETMIGQGTQVPMGHCPKCKGGAKKLVVASDKDAAFRSQRVQITEGSGLGSGKEGLIISWDDPRAKETREDYPFVGGRTPQQMKWLAVLLDDGTVTAMPQNRLSQIKRSAEPIGGEDDSKITSGQGGGMFGGTDLEGPSFHVGFTIRGKRRAASFNSFVQTAKFVKGVASKFGAKDWTMKGAAVDAAQKALVLEWLKTKNLTTREVEARLGGGKYSNTAYPILQELAKEGLVSHKQMRWSLKQAKTAAAVDFDLKQSGDNYTLTPVSSAARLWTVANVPNVITRLTKQNITKDDYVNLRVSTKILIEVESVHLDQILTRLKGDDLLVGGSGVPKPAEPKAHPEGWVPEFEEADKTRLHGMGVTGSLKVIMKTAKKPMPQKGSPEWQQLKICIKTLQMNDAMANVMGGPNKEQSRAVLLSYGIDPLKYESPTELSGGHHQGNHKSKKAGDGMAKTENELEKEAGFNLFFPGQVLQEFYPEIQHEIVDYPNASNSPMGLETPEIVGDGGHELEGVLDEALDTSVVEMIQLPADVGEVESFRLAAADYSSTSPAGGMGIGRDGKPQVLEGAPLHKENGIRGNQFMQEFHDQHEGVPGAALQVASKVAADGEEQQQFTHFLQLVCGEIASTLIAAFKVTQRPLLNKVPGVGEIQLDQMEQGSTTQPTGSTTQGGRVKYVLNKLNDSDVKAAINGAWAQAAVWNNSTEGGFVYEVFVRPETIDTDSMKLTYKFVAGTRE